VGNRYVVAVSRISLAGAHARAGRTADALAEYAEALTDFVRHGNVAHAVNAVRNVMPLVAAIGDHRGATLLAGAVVDDARRASYGAEAERVRQALAKARNRLGEYEVEALRAEGRTRRGTFDRLAVEIVERHRQA